MMENALKRIVLAKFGSLANCAEALGWSHSKLWRITTDRQHANCDEIRSLCEVLNLNDPGEIVAVFSLA